MNDIVHNASAVFSRLNPLDWGMALVLAVSTVAAFMRGLIRSLLSLAGVLLGVLLAGLYAHRVAVSLADWVKSPPLADLAGFVLILGGVIVLAALLGRALKGAVSAVGLGLLDRMGGACFGFVRGVLVLAALLLPLSPFVRSAPVAQTSLLLPYLLPAAHGISFVVPRDLGKRLPATGWLQHASAAASEWTASPVRTVPTGAR